MKLLFAFTVFFLVGCTSSNEKESLEDTFNASALDQVADPGEVQVLDDVYKSAFEAAKATITYEIANARLDAIEAEIQKELNEVKP